MNEVEYKIIPVDRRSGEPAFKSEEVAPQIVINLEEFHRVMRRVNPPEGLVAAVLNDERDKEAMIGTLARAISEMFGGAVYYRKLGEGSWQYEPCAWRPLRRNAG